MNRDEFRALTPWSFFLPMALAVALGMLVANGLGTVFFESDAPGGGEGTSPKGGEAVGSDTPGGAGAAADAAAVASGDGPGHAVAGRVRPGTTVTLEPVRLPGPSSARRDGETRACIGGTIAVRAANGWEQEVVEDAPARCIAASP